MIAHIALLIQPAKEAGMLVPSKIDDFIEDDYPHFTVFCNAQIGAPMPTSYAHWENAKIVASIPDDKIRQISMKELLQLGFQEGYTAK